MHLDPSAMRGCKFLEYSKVACPFLIVFEFIMVMRTSNTMTTILFNDFIEENVLEF